MKLKISNFCKIDHAEIIIDGITVIAGENNTGKSTVGKALFSLFNSVANIESKIEELKREEIRSSCRKMMDDYLDNNRSFHVMLGRTRFYARKIEEEIFRQIQEVSSIDFDMMRQIVYKATQRYDILRYIDGEDQQEVVSKIAHKIDNILNISGNTIALEVLSRYFNKIFYNQVNSLTGKSTKADLELYVKDKKMQLQFENNSCIDFVKELSITNQAIYIDNPFVLDSLNKISFNEMDAYLKKLVTESDQADIMESVIETVMAKEKLSEVFKALQSVVAGKVIQKKDGEFYLEDERFAEPVYISNLSTGLKSFVILKMLVERGAVKEKDLLILDEPEIHLHPQWQVVYAEIIVLLQKYFDLTVIITTHSPYFLDAVNLFSIKHGTGDSVNYYTSELAEDRVKMEQVTDDIESIYKKMASPIQTLDSLRYELNNQ